MSPEQYATIEDHDGFPKAGATIDDEGKSADGTFLAGRPAGPVLANAT